MASGEGYATWAVEGLGAADTSAAQQSPAMRWPASWHGGAVMPAAE
jgi:hypothetical protein